MFSLFITLPFNFIDPELIFSRPDRHFKNVDFPDPLSPINDMNSPLSTVKDRFLIMVELES